MKRATEERGTNSLFFATPSDALDKFFFDQWADSVLYPLIALCTGKAEQGTNNRRATYRLPSVVSRVLGKALKYFNICWCERMGADDKRFLLIRLALLRAALTFLPWFLSGHEAR